MRKEGGEETMEPGGGGGPCGISNGILDLWAPTHLGIITQISGASADCMGRLLDGGCRKYEEGTVEVGSNVEDIGLVGGRCHYLW